MKRILIPLLLIAAAVAALGQTKVACVGDLKMIGAYPVELQRRLGTQFDVKTFGIPGATISATGHGQFLRSPAISAALTFLPDAVVVLFGADRSTTDAEFQIDSFEPALRNLLEKFVHCPSHPKVYLWMLPAVAAKPGTNAMADFFNEYIHPLEAQAAREANAIAFEMDIYGYEPLTAGSVGANEAARTVAELLAPASIKAQWRIVRASSSQADEGQPQNAIDGDPDTFWHTEYDPKLAKAPHELVIDLGESQWLTGFKYLPRQDGGTNGNVKDYEIYVGDSPDSQAALAAKGSFRSGRTQQTARFKASVKARYIRFVCLSEQNGGPWASAAELDVIRDPSRN